jgi:transcriptional regulator with XRE-family HTH domain
MTRRNASVDGPDPIDRYVGVKLREVRVMRGISQQKLAEAIGVSFQQLQKYESGTNRISASALVRMCEALKVPPADLLPAPKGGWKVAKGDAPHARQGRLLTRIVALPQPARQAVTAVVSVLEKAKR